MPNYDRAVIQSFANKLYNQADTMIALFTAGGVACGGLGGFVLGGGLTQNGNGPQVCGVIGAVIVGLFGYFMGESRAFLLKLQAQMALCQAQIEANTREGSRR